MGRGGHLDLSRPRRPQNKKNPLKRLYLFRRCAHALALVSFHAISQMRMQSNKRKAVKMPCKRAKKRILGGAFSRFWTPFARFCASIGRLNNAQKHNACTLVGITS